MRKLILLLIAVLCIGYAYAGCSVDLKLDNPKDTYRPGDYINLTSVVGYPGEGSCIFYAVNSLDEPVGQSESIGTNSSGHANTYFKVGNGWAKGTYKIKVDYSKGSCSTSDIVEVYLDTFTVPVNMDISANYTLQNISKCQNLTEGNVTYFLCLNGLAPIGFDWQIGDINSSIDEDYGNITVDPQRSYYPFSFVKELQDRMTDSVWQKNQLVDSNTRLSSALLNITLTIQNIETENKNLRDGLYTQQIKFWSDKSAQCDQQLNLTVSQTKNQARSSGFATGAIIFFFVGLLIGIFAFILFVRFKSRGDDLGGVPYKGGR
jgi:hypothetical protein